MKEELCHFNGDNEGSQAGIEKFNTSLVGKLCKSKSTPKLNN